MNVYGWRAGAGVIMSIYTTAGDFVADELVLTGDSQALAMLDGLQLCLPVQQGNRCSLALTQPGFYFAKSFC